MPKLFFRLLVCPLALALLAGAARAQTASLIQDINTFGRSQGYSVPFGFHAAGGRLFFFGLGYDVTGVWASDGTPAGTVLLADLCSNEDCQTQRFLGNLEGTVLWTASAQDIQPRLWRSDGTRAGTYPLTGPGTGIVSTKIANFPGSPTHAFFKGAFYFEGCRSESDCRTYRTDGSAAGTVETGPLGSQMAVAGDRLFFARMVDYDVWELRATSDPSAGSTLLGRFAGIRRLTAVGGRLFFTGAAPSQNTQVWVSDGTAVGTRAVTSFTSFSPLSEIWNWFKVIGNRVYFVADDGVHGHELWSTDGTPQGNRRVTEVDAFEPFPRYVPALEEVNGRLVFLAVSGDVANPFGLFAAGSTPESAVELLCSSCELLREPSLVKAGNRVYFLASDPARGNELWSTDGTVAGTHLTADLWPGGQSSVSDADQLQPWPGGLLLMGADDGTHGPEIWLSDGTAAGTRRATDLQTTSLLPDYLPLPVLFQGKVFFGAVTPFAGGLWVTEGEPSSTRQVAFLNHSEPSSSPSHLTVGGDRLFFKAYDGTVQRLWSTQGTPGSTFLFHSPADGVEGLAAAGNLVYFRTGDELWRSDGTAAGAFVLRSHPDLSAGGVVFQGRYFFTAWNELWVSDGTVAGTVVVFRHGHVQTPLGKLAAVGGALWFTAVDDDGRSELWRSDGTEAGTVKLATVDGPVQSLAASGTAVYFSGAGFLWKTDGTPAGTAQALDGAQVAQPEHLTAVPGGIAFFGNGPAGRGLYWSNGTAAGTVLIHEFPFVAFRPSPTELAAFAGRLYYSGGDAEHGFELWTSDGTAAGTFLLRDLDPGWRSSLPHEFTAAGGRLFFVAHDGVHGRELWQTDGTAAGTRLVQDLYPSADSSNPQSLTVSGDRLYFVADDGIAGYELWSYPLAAGPGCQPSPTRLCLSNGRFQVEATWKDFQGRRGSGQAVALTADTGYFWYFDQANVESVVKVLDGRGVNDHFWVFYGALSTVQYHLTVTDTQTGAARRYFNPPGQLACVGDTVSFGPRGTFSRTSPADPVPLAPVRTRVDPAAATGLCQPTAERLCLSGGRFAVEAVWKDFAGKTGTGKAVNLTADTGYLWFFDAANVEVMIKVLDGTGLNGKHWVFYGALSSVEYTITVTDTQTGTSKTYENPSGRLGSVADTGAF